MKKLLFGQACYGLSALLLFKTVLPGVVLAAMLAIQVAVIWTNSRRLRK